MGQDGQQDGPRCSGLGQDGNQDGPAAEQNGRPRSFGRRFAALSRGLSEGFWLKIFCFKQYSSVEVWEGHRQARRAVIHVIWVAKTRNVGTQRHVMWEET